MKVGVLSILFARGQSYLALKVCQALKWNGDEVFLYARTGGVGGKACLETDMKEWEGWIDHLSTYPQYSIPPEIFKIWVKESQLDAVVLIEEQWQLGLAQAIHECGVKVIHIPMNEYINPDDLSFYKYNDVIVAPVKVTKEKLNKLGFDNVKLVPWGIDRDDFKPNPSYKREEEDSATRFLHVSGWGGMCNRRSTEEVLQAFQAIDREKYNNPRLLITRQTHEPYRTTDWVNGVKIEYGTMPREEIIKRYQISDVFVAPTKFSGLELTIPEAMSCGLPVITIDSSPMSEFIFNSGLGLAIKVKEMKTYKGVYAESAEPDVEDLTEALKHFATMDKDTLVSYKKAVLEYADENLDWRKNSKKLTEVIENA